MDMSPVVNMMLAQMMLAQMMSPQQPVDRRLSRWRRWTVRSGVGLRETRLRRAWCRGMLGYALWLCLCLLLLPGCTAESSGGVGSSSGARPEAVDGERQSAEPTTMPQDDSLMDRQRGKVPDTVEQLKVKIHGIYPHDPTAFTQGLVWDGGVLYESTGLYGKSSLRRVDPTTGQVLSRTTLDPNLFGEGLALVEDRLVQLTWKAGVAFAYDLLSLEVIDELGYNGEGWGLAYHDGRLLMSDGSSRITYRDPQDFRWRSTLDIHLQGQPIADLNELEFAEGDLYANVWGQERIVRIDPETGQVEAVIDASGLLEEREKRMVDVLNGIAYDPVSKTFWLTGKFWPKMFQVTFEPVAE